MLAISLVAVSWIFQTRHIIANWKRYKTVSNMYKTERFRRSFEIGLVFTGILQILLALSINFPPTYAELTIGKLIFITGGFGAVLLGLFSIKENNRIHQIASYQYFVGLAIGAVLITIQSELLLPLQISSMLIVFIWVCTIAHQIARKNGRYAIEAFHVLLSYVWIILIGLMHALNA